MNKSLCLLALMILSLSFGCSSSQIKTGPDEMAIRPYTENPRYWQYKNKPLLLLGATDNDNLFQNSNIKSHLDSLKSIGGNYIRNTMSDRDPGDKRAFAISAGGKYDLDHWNEDYWLLFENMLKLTDERDIIVQIEIWDRFDHSRNEWHGDPYNPKNNINYTYHETGLDSLYPSHPGRNEQPFFFTVPELDNNAILLKYQKAFVQKLLSVSLEYDNVLYCIDNETSGTEEWATFWTEFIRENSGGKEIYITQMWDDWDVKADIHKRTIEHPERYGYIDIAQNSHITGRLNWDNARYVFNHIRNDPRPVNSTKIYGGNHGIWLDRGITADHAVQTFCRNILGGFASSRFHRPPHGLGLSLPSINSIKTIRKIEEKVKMWELSPSMDLLTNADGNEAYLAASEGEKYVLFFPGEGSVELNLGSITGGFAGQWISITTGDWGDQFAINGGGNVEISTPGPGGWFAVILKQ